jgi:hypothetical protein
MASSILLSQTVHVTENVEKCTSCIPVPGPRINSSNINHLLFTCTMITKDMDRLTQTFTLHTSGAERRTALQLYSMTAVQYDSMIKEQEHTTREKTFLSQSVNALQQWMELTKLSWST